MTRKEEAWQNTRQYGRVCVVTFILIPWWPRAVGRTLKSNQWLANGFSLHVLVSNGQSPARVTGGYRLGSTGTSASDTPKAEVNPHLDKEAMKDSNINCVNKVVPKYFRNLLATTLWHLNSCERFLASLTEWGVRCPWNRDTNSPRKS